jgi:hypothetical protein
VLHNAADNKLIIAYITVTYRLVYCHVPYVLLTIV